MHVESEKKRCILTLIPTLSQLRMFLVKADSTAQKNVHLETRWQQRQMEYYLCASGDFNGWTSAHGSLSGVGREGPAYGKKIAGPPPEKVRQRDDFRQPLLSCRRKRITHFLHNTFIISIKLWLFSEGPRLTRVFFFFKDLMMNKKRVLLPVKDRDCVFNHCIEVNISWTSMERRHRDRKRAERKR